jgi:hypothetical protein
MTKIGLKAPYFQIQCSEQCEEMRKLKMQDANAMQETNQISHHTKVKNDENSSHVRTFSHRITIHEG